MDPTVSLIFRKSSLCYYESRILPHYLCYLIYFYDVMIESGDEISPNEAFDVLNEVVDFAASDLPPDWSSYFDDNYQTFYYVHIPSGHTQWEYPTADTVIDEDLTLQNRDFVHERKLELDIASMYSDEYPLPNRLVKKREQIDLASSHSQDGSHYGIRLMTESYYKLHSPEKTDAQWYDDNEECLEEESTPRQPFLQLKNNARDRLFDERYEDRIRKRTQQASATNYKGGVNQDYIGMAQLYRIQRPYANPKYKALCILCHENYAQDVFFPCEHHCVCRSCIQKENICEERKFDSTPDGYINCSLCMNIIKLILPLENGREVDKYWQWVYEDKVNLPRTFLRNFKHSAGVIETVYVKDEFKTKKTQSNKGSSSILDTDSSVNNCGVS